MSIERCEVAGGDRSLHNHFQILPDFSDTRTLSGPDGKHVTRAAEAVHNDFMQFDDPYAKNQCTPQEKDTTTQLEILKLEAQILQLELQLLRIERELLANDQPGGKSNPPTDSGPKPPVDSGPKPPVDHGPKPPVDHGPKPPTDNHSPKMIIPAYFPPGYKHQPKWEKILAKAPEGSIIITNNGNGPGQYDKNVDSVVNRAVEKGLKPVGYVAVHAAHKPIEDVKAEIDKWYKNNPGIKGIFLDESAANISGSGGYSHDPKVEAYFKAIGDYVHAKGGMVVMNGAGAPNQDLMNSIDVQTTWETKYKWYHNLKGDQAGYKQNGPEAWQSDYSTDRFAAIVTGVTEADLAAAEKLAKDRGNGYIWVSNDTYTDLPEYFDKEVALF